jgi:hypothetical protein
VTALVKGVSLKGTLARKMLYYEDSKLRRRKESSSVRSQAIYVSRLGKPLFQPLFSSASSGRVQPLPVSAYHSNMTRNVASHSVAPYSKLSWSYPCRPRSRDRYVS